MLRLRTLTAVTALVATTAAGAYEEPRYTVVRQLEGIELRQYAPYLVAETAVAGDFNQARNDAFRLLFAYISGSNRARASMAMTIPVTSRPTGTGERIAMTAPVTSSVAPAAGGHVLQFVVPSHFTVETVPQPTDERVRIRAVDGRLVAARPYSGRANEANYRENEAKLLAALDAAGLAPAGPPLFAVYNGPFTPWFLRRNEVLVPLATPAGAGTAGAPPPGAP